MQYLSFELAGEEFAFGILRVRRSRVRHDHAVPNAPVAVARVINLRGSVFGGGYPRCIGLAPTAITKRPAS